MRWKTIYIFVGIYKDTPGKKARSETRSKTHILAVYKNLIHITFAEEYSGELGISKQCIFLTVSAIKIYVNTYVNIQAGKFTF